MLAREVSLTLRVLLGIFTFTQVTDGSQDVGGSLLRQSHKEIEAVQSNEQARFYRMATFGVRHTHTTQSFEKHWGSRDQLLL